MADERDTHELQSLYQDVMRRRATQTDGGHLDEATWEALAASKLTGELRERAIAHVVECALCARLYRAIDALGREAHTFDAGAPAPPPARADLTRRWLMPALAAAATVLVAVGVSRMFVAPQPASTPALRSRTAPSLVPIEPMATLPGAPERFRWEKFDTIETYRILLFTADGTPLWTSGDVSATELAWPSGVERRTGDYLWRVSGFRDGAAVVESRMIAFRIP